MALNKQQLEMCDSSEWDFSDLSALFLNCTLKPSPKDSYTDDLMNVSKAILEANNVKNEILLQWITTSPRVCTRI